MLFPVDLDARIERARARRQARNPDAEVTFSETLRSLIAVGLRAEEHDETQPELFSEPSTTKLT